VGGDSHSIKTKKGVGMTFDLFMVGVLCNVTLGVVVVFIKIMWCLTPEERYRLFGD